MHTKCSKRTPADDSNWPEDALRAHVRTPCITCYHLAAAQAHAEAHTLCHTVDSRPTKLQRLLRHMLHRTPCTARGSSELSRQRASSPLLRLRWQGGRAELTRAAVCACSSVMNFSALTSNARNHGSHNKECVCVFRRLWLCMLVPWPACLGVTTIAVRSSSVRRGSLWPPLQFCSCNQTV